MVLLGFIIVALASQWNRKTVTVRVRAVNVKWNVVTCPDCQCQLSIVVISLEIKLSLRFYKYFI